MSYSRLTPTLVLQLAAPHTWPASVLPVLLSISLTFTGPAYSQHPLSYTLCALILLCICILLQSAVNTLNDYIDFKKGADTPENQLDPTDAVLVYHNVNPKSALVLACGFIAAAFALGVFVVLRAGVVPLIFAVIGAIIIVLYSGGKTPISYLPIGELVSGITMGGLMTIACIYSLENELVFNAMDCFIMLGYSVPFIIWIGLIMMTNNTCDIDKDREAHRKTLPALLGRYRAVGLYHACISFSIIIVPVVIIKNLLPVLAWAIVVILAYPSLKALWNNPLTLDTRKAAMQQCLGFVSITGLGYCIVICIYKALLAA